MPISNYNKDGTVNIYNRKTGEVRNNVKPEELANISPTLTDEYYQNNTPQEQAERLKAETDMGGGKTAQEKLKVKEELKANAEAVQNVLEMKKKGVLKGKDFEDALNYAASRYNASSGFAEGGKQLTGPELAVLAGSMLKFEQPRNQNIIEKITGYKPPIEGKIIDNIDTIDRKTRLALGQDISKTTDTSSNQSNPLRDILTKPFDTNQKAQLEQELSKNPAVAALVSTLFSGVQPAGQQSQLQNPSVGGFVNNVKSGAENMVGGLVQSAPALGAEAFGLGGGPLAQLLTGGKNPVTQKPLGELTGQTAAQIPASMTNLSYRLGENPGKAVYDQPVEQILNSVAIASMAKPLLSKVNGSTKASPIASIKSDMSEQGVIKQLDQAIASSDYTKARQILKSIPDNAPFKSKVTKIFDEVLPTESPALNKILSTGGSKTAPKGAVNTLAKKAGDYLTEDVVKIETDPSIWGASQEAAIRNTKDVLGIKGTPAQQYAQLAPKMEMLGNQIDDVIANNPRSYQISEVTDAFNKNMRSTMRQGLVDKPTVDALSKQYIQDVYSEVADNPNVVIPETITNKELFGLKQKVNKDYQSVAKALKSGTTLTPSQQVVAVARQTLDDLVSSNTPGLKKLTTMQSHLYDMVEPIYKARSASTTAKLPLPGLRIPIPGARYAIQTGKDSLGRILKRGGSVK